MVKVYCLLVTLVISACSTMNERMDSWVGHNVDEAISSFGPPAKEREISSGKVYEWSQNNGSSASAQTNYGITDVTAYNMTCTWRFTTDKSGVIRSHSWNGNACN